MISPTSNMVAQLIPLDSLPEGINRAAGKPPGSGTLAPLDQPVPPFDYWREMGQGSNRPMQKTDLPGAVQTQQSEPSTQAGTKPSQWLEPSVLSGVFLDETIDLSKSLVTTNNASGAFQGYSPEQQARINQIIAGLSPSNPASAANNPHTERVHGITSNGISDITNPVAGIPDGQLAWEAKYGNWHMWGAVQHAMGIPMPPSYAIAFPEIPPDTKAWMEQYKGTGVLPPRDANGILQLDPWGELVQAVAPSTTPLQSDIGTTPVCSLPLPDQETGEPTIIPPTTAPSVWPSVPAPIINAPMILLSSLTPTETDDTPSQTEPQVQRQGARL